MSVVSSSTEVAVAVVPAVEVRRWAVALITRLCAAALEVRPRMRKYAKAPCK